MIKIVYAHIEGFTKVGTVGEVQEWWDVLKKRYDFTGKKLSMWVSTELVPENSRIFITTNKYPTKVYTI